MAATSWLDRDGSFVTFSSFIEPTDLLKNDAPTDLSVGAIRLKVACSVEMRERISVTI